MMRIRPIPTSLTLLMAAIVMAAPVVANLFIAHAQTPPPKYCSASICADARNITKSNFNLGPDFGVHYFTLKDGSNAGVYVGGYPQRPAAGTPQASETIDGVACDRYVTMGSDGANQVAVYCDWRRKPDDFPTVIHAWAAAPSAPDRSEAMDLVRSLRRCADAECPWPKS